LIASSVPLYCGCVLIPSKPLLEGRAYSGGGSF
jgi:hypothetical protein